MPPVAFCIEDPQLGIFQNQVIWEEKAVEPGRMVEPRGTELEKPWKTHGEIKPEDLMSTPDFAKPWFMNWGTTPIVISSNT